VLQMGELWTTTYSKTRPRHSSLAAEASCHGRAHQLLGTDITLTRPKREAPYPAVGSGRCGRRRPRRVGLGPEAAEGWPGDQVGLDVEGVVDGGVAGEEPQDRLSSTPALSPAGELAGKLRRQSCAAFGSLTQSGIERSKKIERPDSRFSTSNSEKPCTRRVTGALPTMMV
jgi:hypothetical protein